MAGDGSAAADDGGVVAVVGAGDFCSGRTCGAAPASSMKPEASVRRSSASDVSLKPSVAARVTTRSNIFAAPARSPLLNWLRASLNVLRAMPGSSLFLASATMDTNRGETSSADGSNVGADAMRESTSVLASCARPSASMHSARYCRASGSCTGASRVKASS